MGKGKCIFRLTVLTLCFGLLSCCGRPSGSVSSATPSAKSSPPAATSSIKATSSPRSTWKAHSNSSSSPTANVPDQKHQGSTDSTVSEIECPLCKGSKTVQCGYCSGTGKDPASGGLCTRCKDKNGKLKCYNCEGFGTILTNDPDKDSKRWDYNTGRDKTKITPGNGSKRGDSTAMTVCPLCKGLRICPVCGGSKKIYVPDYGTGSGGSYVYCEGCHGSGLCYECGGVGSVLP